MRFRPVTTRRVVEAVVEQITDAIRAGELKVKDRLPPERTMAAQFEVSRPTVRAAIKLLVDAGVVETRPGSHGGTFVRSDVISRDILREGAPLHIGEVTDVLKARRLLEPRVAQLAAVEAADADFEALRAVTELQRRHRSERARFLQLDHRFHLGIAQATHNTMVVTLMRQLLRRLGLAQELALRSPWEPDWAIDVHEQTIAALVSGDPIQIEAVMDRHLGYLESIWDEEMRARGSRIPVQLSPGIASTVKEGGS
jgi:DNA-binding FadR family transcriptional regulator